MVFELADDARDLRWIFVISFGGFCKAAKVRHISENVQLMNIHSCIIRMKPMIIMWFIMELKAFIISVLNNIEKNNDKKYDIFGIGCHGQPNGEAFVDI